MLHLVELFLILCWGRHDYFSYSEYSSIFKMCSHCTLFSSCDFYAFEVNLVLYMRAFLRSILILILILIRTN